MKYFIQRELNEYGPYTLTDLQRYVSQGSILLTDLTRSEGMTEWVPVSQVIGNIPAPMATPPVPPVGSAPVPSGGTVYGGTGTVYDPTTSGYGVQSGPVSVNGPVPTDLHWGLVLLIGVFTCGLFSYAWMIVESVFVKKIKSDSKGLLFVALGIAGFFLSAFIGGVMNALQHGDSNPFGPLISLASFVLYIVGMYQIKGDLEDYYNTTEPINLRLSGVMVFFFNVLYFQHHLSRIAKWKKTGILQPQG
jgi:GYF domain 2